MAKIIKINNDADYYYERGITKSDASEFIDAIDSFYQALYREGENIYIYSEIAGGYLDLDLTDEALKLFYRIIVIDKKSEIGYLGAMQCLIRNGMIPQAVFYLNMGIKNNALSNEFELDEAFFEDNEPRFKLADKHDRSEMVSFARKLMLSGDTVYATQMLESIPETAKQYDEARNYLALIALGENDTEKALKITDEVLSRDDTDVPALTTRIVAYDIVGDSENMNRELERLLDLNLTEKSDINKAAACMQQIGNSELAARYLRRALEFQPYDRDIMLLLAIAENNNKNHAEAKKLMLVLRKLYRDDMTVRYYARLVNRGHNRILELSAELPGNVAKFRLGYIKNRLAALKSVDAVVSELDTNERFYEAVMWLFQSDEYRLIGQVGAYLCRDEEWQIFILDLLIDPNVHYHVKKECLLAYLLHSKSKKFYLLIADVLQQFRPRLPKVTENPMLIGAYWRLYTTLSFIDYDFDKRLNDAYRTVVKAVQNADFERFELSPSTLAAIIANYGKLHKIFENPIDACEIFGCDETEMRTYMDVLSKSLPKQRKPSNGGN